MAGVLEDIENAFQSARLQYIRPDAIDAQFKAFVPQVVQDPVIQVLAIPTILQPKGKTDFESYVRSVGNSILGVAICLLPEEQRRRQQETEGGQNDSSQVNESGKLANENNEEDAEPTIIGVMCLGWGGVSSSVAHHRNAQIGISFAKPYQNKGYGRESINWMLDWAFTHAGLHSVGICAASYNPRAIHLYEDIGFVLEGRRREIIWFNRGWHDELEFGLTEREWEALRGRDPL